MLKKISILTVFAAVFVFISAFHPVSAESIINETFENTDNISALTAAMDNGEILLKRNFGTNFIAINSSTDEYAVVTDTGIDFYTYNGSEMEIDSGKSITGLVNPIGVAMRQDMYGIWVLTTEELRRYDFNGTEMEYNGLLSVNLTDMGISNAIALSAHPEEDWVVILSKTPDDRAVITTLMVVEDGGLRKNEELCMTSLLAYPTSVSIVPEDYSIVVTNPVSACYFTYDAGDRTYKLNADMSVFEGLSDIRTVTCFNDGYGYLLSNGHEAWQYVYDVDRGYMARIPNLDVNFGAEACVTSGSVNEYEFVVLMRDRSVRYYKYDEDDDCMKEDPDYLAHTSGEVFGYLSEGVYISNVISTAPVKVSTIRLLAEYDMPAGTGIEYAVSYDGGVIFEPVILNSDVVFDTDITDDIDTNKDSFCVRVKLMSSDPNVTPRLRHLILEGDMELILIPPREEFEDIFIPVERITGLGAVFDGRETRNSAAYYYDPSNPKLYFVPISAGSQALLGMKTTESVDEVSMEIRIDGMEEAIHLDTVLAPQNVNNYPAEGVDKKSYEKFFVGVYGIPADAYNDIKIFVASVTLTDWRGNSKTFRYDDDNRNGYHEEGEKNGIPLLLIDDTVLNSHDIHLTE